MIMIIILLITMKNKNNKKELYQLFWTYKIKIVISNYKDFRNINTKNVFLTNDYMYRSNLYYISIGFAMLMLLQLIEQ